MSKQNKLLSPTGIQQQISDLLYSQISHIYCDNCRFNSEINKENFEKENGYWGCEDCYRKYMGWEISKAACDNLAKKIGEINNV